MTLPDTPLEMVWNTYTATRDCIALAERLGQDRLEVFIGTNFIGLSSLEMKERMESCQIQSGDYAILAMWSVFESFVMDYLRDKGSILQRAHPEALSRRLHVRFQYTIRYWRIEDVLDILKGIVDPELIGKAKEIKKYRDWLAHRDQQRKPDKTTGAEFAYQILSRIMETIRGIG